MDTEKKNEQTRIIISNETPIEYWCKLLNCEKQDLLQAISVIGNSLTVVDSYLFLNRKKNK